MLSACSNEQDLEKSLYEVVFEKTQNDNLIEEQYQSCVLFAELLLIDAELEIILSALEAKNKPNLCDSYILASQTQDPHYVEAFIKFFPISKKQSKIWSLHSKLGHPVSFVPPYITLLRVNASNNDMALDKLISALPYNDASHAESLSEMIATLYNVNPDRVNNSFKRNKIADKTIQEVEQLAEYLKAD
jgi:hypothetical protein